LAKQLFVLTLAVKFQNTAYSYRTETGESSAAHLAGLTLLLKAESVNT